ncbi:MULTISPECIES: hypothetical protein [Methylomicrobium]|uniref:hypothetical protein n=1 Tax=Methylomicrobium TaxID=39773 RepID=UPI001FE125F4|nr:MULTISPECIES: hypothetical protein [Methylomicrobium]
MSWHEGAALAAIEASIAAKAASYFEGHWRFAIAKTPYNAGRVDSPSGNPPRFKGDWRFAIAKTPYNAGRVDSPSGNPPCFEGNWRFAVAKTPYNAGRVDSPSGNPPCFEGNWRFAVAKTPYNAGRVDSPSGNPPCFEACWRFAVAKTPYSSFECEGGEKSGRIGYNRNRFIALVFPGESIDGQVVCGVVLIMARFSARLARSVRRLALGQAGLDRPIRRLASATA